MSAALGPKETSSAGFRGGGRRPLRLARHELVEMGSLPGGGDFPLVVRPRHADTSLAAWAAAERPLLGGLLATHGAILFRGFAIDSVERFREVARAVTPDLLDYRERAAPRIEVGAQVFTSTEYPADQPIPLHHEMSYSHNWPAKLWFCCLAPATRGGSTPIADDRKVIALLDPRIRRRFAERGVMYVRNYGGGVDLPWQEVFQTGERAAVEAYCRRARIAFEWRDGDRLRTRAVRQVTATHPTTGDTVWFNHAHMFHVSNLESRVRAALLAEFEPDELPRNAFYGDGSPIEDAVAEEIRATYRSHAVAFPWQAGDVLWLDNFLASHGREPFAGPRRVVVAMAELYTDPGLGLSGEPLAELG